MSKVNKWVKALNLTQHPEGGFYRETYRSAIEFDSSSFPGKRSLLTSIYFLLEEGSISAFHRIKSDELWFHQDGDALHVHVIKADGSYELKALGKDLEKGEQLQHLVSAGDWFATELCPDGKFGLVACAVAPGFDFDDFELADSSLIKAYPQHEKLIARLLVK